jgi:hypothetical protein
MDRDEISNHYRGPSIDASYQVSVHLAEGFQRRRLKCEKLTDDRRRTPSDDKSWPCLRQGERWAIKLHAVLILFCKKKILTSFGNQGVQTTRKDNKIIWNEGLDSDGQQFHHCI